jgi:hypothetical protein
MKRERSSRGAGFPRRRLHEPRSSGNEAEHAELNRPIRSLEEDSVRHQQMEMRRDRQTGRKPLNEADRSTQRLADPERSCLTPLPSRLAQPTPKRLENGVEVALPTRRLPVRFDAIPAAHFPGCTLPPHGPPRVAASGRIPLRTDTARNFGPVTALSFSPFPDTGARVFHRADARRPAPRL